MGPVQSGPWILEAMIGQASRSDTGELTMVECPGPACDGSLIALVDGCIAVPESRREVPCPWAGVRVIPSPRGRGPNASARPGASMTAGPFVAASHLNRGAVKRERLGREFERLVNDDLRDKYAAGPAYAVLSRPENRIRWLHVLVGICESIKTQDAHDHAALYARPDKPVGGGPTPDAYAEAKRVMLERRRSRNRTMQAVEGRIREVRRLIGTDLVPERMVGDVVGELVTVLRVVRASDLEDAARRITALILAVVGDASDTTEQASG